MYYEISSSLSNYHISNFYSQQGSEVMVALNGHSRNGTDKFCRFHRLAPTLIAILALLSTVTL